MAITTTSKSFKQDCLFHGNVDFAGNKVTIGKDLEVDGTLALNSFDDFSISDGTTLTKKLTEYVRLDNLPPLFRHSVTLRNATNNYQVRFSTIARTSFVADSFQNLCMLFPNTDFACNGYVSSTDIGIMIHVGTSALDTKIYSQASTGVVTEHPISELGFVELSDSVTLVTY